MMKRIFILVIFSLILLCLFLTHKEISKKIQAPVQIQEPLEIIRILTNKNLPNINMKELYGYEYNKTRNQWCFKFGNGNVDNGYFLYIKDSKFKSIDILLFPPLWDKIYIK